MAKHCYDFPRPMVTADVVLFAWIEEALQVLLIKRKADPFAGCWALPGGFIGEQETLKQSAARELREETGIRGIELNEFRTYGDPGRDPRGRTITIAYIALAGKGKRIRPRAGDDAADVAWFRVSRLPLLAFDHLKILTDSIEHLRRQLRSGGVAAELLGRDFRVQELQRVHEAILGSKLDGRRFRRQFRDVEQGTGMFLR
jgi:8-oxo-dGTP diphosphatase